MRIRDQARAMAMAAASAALVMMAGVNGTSAQSFSCEMAHTVDEETVCRTPWLRRLDMIMAEQYSAVKKYLRRQRATRREWARHRGAQLTEGQRRFVSARAACAADVACIGGAYEQRIMELVHMWKALME